MGKPITWVGIDDGKKHLAIGVLRGEEQQEADVCRIPNEDGALRRWVRKLMRTAAGGEIRMCYESGPNGFALMRRIEAMAPVVVEVTAPSLTPRRAGQRVKTDPIDARKLAALYRAGELRAIATPDEESEAARDLVRTYHRAAEEVTRKRHHVLKFLIRRGRIYRDGHHWTNRHREWLRSQDWDDWKDRVSFEEMASGLRELEDRRRRLEAALDELAKEGSRSVSVVALRYFQGIATWRQGNSSTDHGHAVSAREYQTDSSSKRPAPLTPRKVTLGWLTGHSISVLWSHPQYWRGVETKLWKRFGFERPSLVACLTGRR